MEHPVSLDRQVCPVHLEDLEGRDGLDLLDPLVRHLELLLAPLDLLDHLDPREELLDQVQYLMIAILYWCRLIIYPLCQPN